MDPIFQLLWDNLVCVFKSDIHQVTGLSQRIYLNTVKLGDKERFDKEQIGFKEPFPVTKCQLLHKE